MMKPKIIHLLDDHNVGGVTRWVETISASDLKDQFEFELVRSTNLSDLSYKPDLVIYHNPHSWKRSQILIGLKRQNLPIIAYEHHYCAGFEQLNVPSQFRFRKMLKWNYRWLDRVVAVSHGQADWMQSSQLVRSQKLVTIPVRTRLDHLLEVPQKQLQQPFTLGAYGRFSRQKGFDTLLKAMRQVKTPIQLYLGGYGEDENLLKSLAADQPNIKFWGSVKDVPGFLSACDAISMPSRWEPGGLVCSEAKAAGKPLIVSKIDSLTEQVQNCGIAVTPDDVNQLAAAIDTIATATPTQLKIWGETAQAQVRDAWQQHLQAWEHLISSVLRSKV